MASIHVEQPEVEQYFHNNNNNIGTGEYHHDGDSDDDDDEDDHDSTTSHEQQHTITYKEIQYAINSFYAIVQPVFLTMLLSAFAVVYISTPEVRSAYEANLSNAYTVYNDIGESDDNTIVKVGQAFINGLVMVSVICLATFVIVLLYKYNCMTCLWGYMIAANTLLLGFVSSLILSVAIEKYQLQVDKISFYFFVYNLAIVGVMAIFGSTDYGIPMYMTQFYLILCSVIVAWQLSHFNEWTAWSLLIMLALYDLFAVLTPCGPLKALVHLMQEENSPNMPGLLYEANVRNNNNNNNISSSRSTTTNRVNTITNNTTTSNQSRNTNENGNNTIVPTTRNTNHVVTTAAATTDQPTSQANDNRNRSNLHNNIGESHYNIRSAPNGNTTLETLSSPNTRPVVAMSSMLISSSVLNQNVDMTESTNTESEHTDDPPVLMDRETNSTYRSDTVLRNPDEAALTVREALQSLEGDVIAPITRRTGSIPFAIAKIYGLPTVLDPQPPWIIERNVRQARQPTREEATSRRLGSTEEPNGNSTVPNLPSSRTSVSNNVNNSETSVENNHPEQEHRSTTEPYTPQQLAGKIKVIFPLNGGLIRKEPKLYQRDRRKKEIRWQVIDRNGIIKRTLFVNPDTGKVYEVVAQDNSNHDEDDEKERNSIRLGLGDFIFYSILVSKAALYRYTTFVACIIAIITGLALTLLLLAVYGKALPALPISIALGVLFYLHSRYVLEPYIQDIIFYDQREVMFV